MRMDKKMGKAATGISLGQSLISTMKPGLL